MKKKDQFKSLMRKKARDAAAALISAFYWGDTKEGFAYWKEVHDRLEKIGRNGRNVKV